MTIRVLSLGACQLVAPVNSLIRMGKIRDCWLAGQQAVPCYCVGDAMQTMRYARGRMDLPEGMRFFCGLHGSGPEPVDGSHPEQADIMVINCNTPIALCLDDIYINHNLMLRGLDQPIAAANSELSKVYNTW